MRFSHGTALCLACMMLAPARHAMAAFQVIAQADVGQQSSLSTANRALTLESAFEIAERESPELRALRSDDAWVEGRLETAKQIPNPELDLLVEDYSRRPSDDESEIGNIKAELGQPIELGGKRSSRMELAQVEGRARRIDGLLTRLRLRFDVGTAFIQTYELQQNARLAAERSELAKRLHQAAVERVKAGKIAPIEETRLRSNATVATIEFDEKIQELNSARLKLATLLGVGAGSISEVTFPLEDVSEPGDQAKMQTRLRIGAAARKANLVAEKSKAELAVEESKKFPDLTLKVEANYQPYEKRYLFGAGFSLPLPIFDRNQGARNMASAQLQAASALAERESKLLDQELSDAHGELISSFKKARMLKSDVLPGLEETFAALETAYRQGRVGYLDIVESQESLFSVRERYLNALARYHIANFKIGFLTAHPDDSTAGRKQEGMNEVTK